MSLVDSLGKQKEPVILKTPSFTNSSSITLSRQADQQKEDNQQPVLIGIAGGTASGKTTFSNEIIEFLNKNNMILERMNVALISMDSFYRNLTAEESVEAAKRNFNFDCEDAFDFAYLHNTLQRLKNGEAVQIFEYDFVNNRRKEDVFVMIEKPDVVILEGILTLHNSSIRRLLNIKLYIECDLDFCLARRIERDIKFRGRKLEDILDQYFKFVKPGYHQAIHPSKAHADLTVNANKGRNKVAIELICVWIKDLIFNRRGVSPAPSPNLSPSLIGPIVLTDK